MQTARHPLHSGYRRLSGIRDQKCVGALLRTKSAGQLLGAVGLYLPYRVDTVLSVNDCIVTHDIAPAGALKGVARYLRSADDAARVTVKRREQ